MAKKKLAKVQDIPGMKIYDSPDGPEMYATDKRGGWPDLYWEAKRICHKVRITKSSRTRYSSPTSATTLWRWWRNSRKR